MKQTETYQFKLIETSDTFSPDALNDNARTTEAELARVEAAISAGDAALAAKHAALAAAVGSGGKNARVAWGTYTGTGEYTKDHPSTLTFDFKPIAVLIALGASTFQILLRDAGFPIYDYAYYSKVTEWTDRSVTWRNEQGAHYQFNTKDQTYYWVAIGEPLD